MSGTRLDPSNARACVVRDQHLRFNGSVEGLVKVALDAGAKVGDTIQADFGIGLVEYEVREKRAAPHGAVVEQVRF